MARYTIFVVSHKLDDTFRECVMDAHKHYSFSQEKSDEVGGQYQIFRPNLYIEDSEEKIYWRTTEESALDFVKMANAKVSYQYE